MPIKKTASAAKAKTAAKKPTVKKTAKKKVLMFISVRAIMHHPFAKVDIPLGPPGIQLDADDSWLKSQIDRGLVKEL